MYLWYSSQKGRACFATVFEEAEASAKQHTNFHVYVVEKKKKFLCDKFN